MATQLVIRGEDHGCGSLCVVQQLSRHVSLSKHVLDMLNLLFALCQDAGAGRLLRNQLLDN
eukprot:2792959-Pleurochrysis_carterae.AAC.1